jgi:hypothetical protein
MISKRSVEIHKGASNKFVAGVKRISKLQREEDIVSSVN